MREKVREWETWKFGWVDGVRVRKTFPRLSPFYAWLINSSPTERVQVGDALGFAGEVLTLFVGRYSVYFIKLHYSRSRSGDIDLDGVPGSIYVTEREKEKNPDPERRGRI